MSIDSPLHSWPLLESVDDVLDAVGGTFAASVICRRPPQQVSNWRNTGFFSPRTFLLFQAELAKRQLRARPSLWRLDEPAEW